MRVVRPNNGNDSPVSHGGGLCEQLNPGLEGETLVNQSLCSHADGSSVGAAHGGGGAPTRHVAWTAGRG